MRIVGFSLVAAGLAWIVLGTIFAATGIEHMTELQANMIERSFPSSIPTADATVRIRGLGREAADRLPSVWPGALLIIVGSVAVSRPVNKYERAIA